MQRCGDERTFSGVAGGDDEAELWRASLAGSGVAFSRLFVILRDRVFRHATRLVDSLADADDVTAAAFFELWRHRAGVRVVDGSPLPWLLVTTTNLARNVRRGTARYRAVLDRLPRLEDLSDPADQALARVARDRGETLMRSAMSQLSVTDLNLLVLTTLEGLSVQGAAATLGMKEGTARSRLSRARSRLRVALGDGDDAALAAVTEGA